MTTERTGPIACTDVLIVGAGPVGLFTVFQCGMRRVRCHVIDTFEAIGGQCAHLYPEKPIYDIPAYPEILAGELVERLERQIRPFAPVFHLGQAAELVHRTDDDEFIVETSKRTRIRAKAIVIAAGAGAFRPARPALEGLERFEQKSVFYEVKEKEYFRGKRVVIAGGGDSAVDWALELSELAEHISVVHRRPAFRAAPHSAEKLSALAALGRISVEKPYQLKAVVGSSEVLQRVDIVHADGQMRSIPADALLLFFGLSATLGPIAKWGLAVSKGRLLVDPATMSTSLAGIYAVGDIANYPGKLKLILCGFSEAAIAAHALHLVVRPQEIPYLPHSTVTGIPAL